MCVTLGQYFFFSRDRLSPAAPGARLSAPLQALLSKLQSPVPAQRRPAVKPRPGCRRRNTLPLYSALLDRAVRRPESDAMTSVLELTAKVPEQLADIDCRARERCRRAISRPALPLRLLAVGKDQADGQRAARAVGCSRPHESLQKAVAGARRTLAEMGTSANNTGGTGGGWTDFKRNASYFARYGGRDRVAKTLAGFVGAMGGAARRQHRRRPPEHRPASRSAPSWPDRPDLQAWRVASKPSGWNTSSGRIASRSSAS